MQPPSNARTDRAACWIVTDGAAGNLRQARALASAMHVDAVELEVKLRGPWRWFSPRLTNHLPLGVSGDLRAKLKSRQWPAMAIGCGRQAASVTRALRSMSAPTPRGGIVWDAGVDPARFAVLI